MDTSHAVRAAASRTRWILLPLGSLLSLSALGLSIADLAFNQQPRYRVTGRVTCNGVPAANAVVAFHPLDQALLVHPQAIADADGCFELRTPLAGAGAPSGEYAVTVAWRPWVVDGEHYGPGRNVLPKEYSHSSRTPIRATVASKTNQLSAWHLPQGNNQEE